MPGRHDVGSCPTAATDDVSFGYLKSSFAWLQHLHLAVCLKQLGFRGRMFRIDERFKTQEKQMETELRFLSSIQKIRRLLQPFFSGLKKRLM